MKALRVNAPVEAPSGRREIVVTPAILEGYPGTYQLRSGFDLVITLENGRLAAQATGLQKLPLFATSDSRFIFNGMDAELEFFRLANGKVAYLILHQGGADIKALRQ